VDRERRFRRAAYDTRAAWALTLVAAATIQFGVACSDGSPRPGDNSSKLVGSSGCASCHATEYAAWAKSQHAAAMQEAQRPGAVLGRFDGTTFTNAGVTSRFFRRGENYFVNTEGADGSLHDFEIRYTFGVYPLQQYLVAFPDGRMQPLPVAWDSRSSAEGGQRWFHLTPGPRVTHTDEMHWTGRQQNWNFMCAECHSTGVRKGYDARTDRFQTTWSDINVGCEACHGPGTRHAGWAAYPKLLRRFVWRDSRLPARLDERKNVKWTTDSRTGNAQRSVPRRTDREIESCAPCHSRRVQIAEGYTAGSPLLDYYVPSLVVGGLYHPDGQQRDEVYNYVSFLQSRMNHAGVTCADCHEPHTQQLRATGNAVCAQCHLPAKYNVPTHTLHPRGATGSTCASCHMSATVYMQIDPRLDHSIRIPRPDLTVSTGVPNACTGCHIDKSAEWAAAQISSHFGPTRKGFQQFANAFTADDRSSPGAARALSDVAADTTEPAVVRASALARLAGRPGDVAFVRALTSAGDSSALVRRTGIGILEAYPPRERFANATLALLSDPVRAVRVEAARLLAPVSDRLADGDRKKAFDRAAREFVESQRLHADRPENRTELGIFFSQRGQTAEADSEYRAALRLAPRYEPAYVNLADLLRTAGRDSDAEAILRAGVNALPNDATLHHALGLSLVRSKQLSAALPELEHAASLAPDQPHFAYVYGVALHSAKRDRDATAVLEKARIRSPNDPELLFALVTINRDAGNRAAALRFAQLLARIHPNDKEARALLESLQPAPAR
jgi:Flp pilus assembly protein TadD